MAPCAGEEVFASRAGYGPIPLRLYLQWGPAPGYPGHGFGGCENGGPAGRGKPAV